MTEPMPDDVLADYERGFAAEGELRGVDACREIRRLRHQLISSRQAASTEAENCEALEKIIIKGHEAKTEPMDERQRDFLFSTVMSLDGWSRSRKEGNYDTVLLDEAISILKALLKGQPLPNCKDSGLTYKEIFGGEKP